MKKLQLFILLPIILGLLAYVDYTANVPDGMKLPDKPSITEEDTVETPAPKVLTHPNLTQVVLDSSSNLGDYKIEKRSRSIDLFEIFNLSEVSNIGIYKNILISKGLAPIHVYEIHGPNGEGNVTYLNLKLKLIEQIGSAIGINETGSYGYNSLFYNNSEDEATGYLLAQIEDNVFGFKYSKLSPSSFETVEKFLEASLSNLNQ